MCIPTNWKPGMRVAAYHYAKDKVVYLGEGVYEGKHRHPDYGDELDEMGMGNNPRIKLDSGNTVWGCECWWGPVEDIKTHLREKGIEVDND